MLKNREKKTMKKISKNTEYFTKTTFLLSQQKGKKIAKTFKKTSNKKT